METALGVFTRGKSKIPKVKSKSEVNNPIDQFILARLEKKNQTC
jgi:hypothetical protein